MTNPLPLMRVEQAFRPLVFPASLSLVATATLGWVDAGLIVRTVRGRKMRTLERLMDEFAAALQFPLHFGENMDAFDECVADLESLPRAAGFVLVITEAEEVLIDADLAALTWLGSSLDSASQVWAGAIDLGEWWDRPPYPFHVVLSCLPDDEAEACRRWSKAGLEIDRFVD